MQFNYDNPWLFLGIYPHYSCGQFLISCLSLANELCIVGTDEIVDQCLEGIDTKQKLSYLIKSLPLPTDSYWHERFYSSGRWYSNASWAKQTMDVEDDSTGSIISGLTSTMRSYMDMRWRDKAKQVSNSRLGFLLAGHDQLELDGWQQILGQRKYFTVGNYEKIRDLMLDLKNKKKKDLIKWHDDNSPYKPSGMVFDVEALLRDDKIFITQMKAAYEYFCITGLDEEALLILKKSYIKSCLDFRLTSKLKGNTI